MYNIKIDGTPFTKEYISNRIKEIANDNEDTKLLMSVPGISFYSALLVLSEIWDINRFPDSGHLV